MLWYSVRGGKGGYPLNYMKTAWKRAAGRTVIFGRVEWCKEEPVRLERAAWLLLGPSACITVESSFISRFLSAPHWRSRLYNRPADRSLTAARTVQTDAHRWYLYLVAHSVTQCLGLPVCLLVSVFLSVFRMDFKGFHMVHKVPSIHKIPEFSMSFYKLPQGFNDFNEFFAMTLTTKKYSDSLKFRF